LAIGGGLKYLACHIERSKFTGTYRVVRQVLRSVFMPVMSIFRYIPTASKYSI